MGSRPPWTDIHKNWQGCRVHDVINHTKFGFNIFRGFRSTGGQNFRFPIDFAGHRYNSAAATAQPVIVIVIVNGPFFSRYFSIFVIVIVNVNNTGCEPQSWGIGGRRRSGMAPFERALVTSYRLSILHSNFSSIYAFQRYCRFCSPPLISHKFLHVPLGLGGWPLGCDEQRCWSN